MFNIIAIKYMFIWLINKLIWEKIIMEQAWGAIADRK